MAGVRINIPDGQYTMTIYKMIKDLKYADCVQVLNTDLQDQLKSRAALSLLGFCYYRLQNYEAAASCYEELVSGFPEVEEYNVYYAQIMKLQAAIKYAEDDLPNAKMLMEDCSEDDPDTLFNMGCILYKEERYREACAKFNSSMQVHGYKADTCYCVALCYFSLKQYSAALKYITEIIERGIKEHPELSVGMQTESVDIRSVGNTLVLQETALIEAFNLKAAIEYQLKNYEAAQEAITDMPPRSEEELDPVTLHNQALMNMEDRPTEGFEKIQYLLQQPTCPKEAFSNLLLLYIKFEYYDLAADVLAENSHLIAKFLSHYIHEFIDARITQKTSPNEAFRKLDIIATGQTEKMRKLSKKVQEYRSAHNDAAVKSAVEEYDDTLECYIPVLMAQAKIYWEIEKYQNVEKIFRKSVEFCSEHNTWRLNVAHVLFMQETKFKEASGFYEAIVKKNYEHLVGISAIILANLCVSYIMTGHTEKAEEIMKKIEKEEEDLAYHDPDKKQYHLCIVNLVIGTLYCAKGNYEFGITRIMKSLEPYNKKFWSSPVVTLAKSLNEALADHWLTLATKKQGMLGTDTWFYAKRCFCSLLENMAKHMILLKDSTAKDVIQFFEHCESYGRGIFTVVGKTKENQDFNEGKNTVTYEARMLKALFLRLT